MRLVDVVNQVRRRASEGTNIFRYPIQVVSQTAHRIGQQWYENIKLPGGTKLNPFSNVKQLAEPAANVTVSDVEPVPLSSLSQPASPILPIASATVQITSRLQLGTLIKSRWSSYTIGDCLEEGDRTRLYEGKTRGDEPILVKEYQLFDYDLRPSEIEERQKAFERLIELNLKIGNGPDFRIVKLIDALTIGSKAEITSRSSENTIPRKEYLSPSQPEHRCYLITKPISRTTLETHIAQSGFMTAKQIREVLRQVLESLRFLHTAYRVHFPSGVTERGLPHGNLSLKSLLIRHLEAEISYERQFFIYLADLELWEHLFHPSASHRFHTTIAKSGQDLGSVKQDLADLGLVGLCLAGGSIESEPDNLQIEHLRVELDDEPLLQFIQKLLGSTSFNSAEEALHILRQLPEPPSGTTEIPPSIPAEPEEVFVAGRGFNRLGLIALLSLGMGLLGLLSWFVWKDMILSTVIPPVEKILGGNPKITRIRDKPAPVSSGSLTYLVEPGGAWHYALARQFMLNTAPNENMVHESLISAIESRYPGLVIKQLDNAQNNQLQDNDLINQMSAGAANVGFMTLPERLPENLDKRPVAYDALVVFVPFNDPYHFRETEVVKKLNRSITIDQLRQLYTGDTDIPYFPGQQFQVRLFFSENEETLQLFKSKVLENDPELIKRFQALEAQVRARDRAAASADHQPQDVYNRMWVDFNRQDNGGIMGIGFDRLGRMFDQCSVYPLAIGEGVQATQVLVRSNRKAIDENTDLCGAKGSYFPDIQKYPEQLKYELGVVFPKGSQIGPALADILTTTEGQYLMSEVGLVPMQPVSTMLSTIWDQGK